MLALLEVADRDYGLLGPAEQLLEPCKQTGLGDLAPHVAAELELAEDVLVVERREARVELVLLLDVRLELGEVRRLPVERAQLGLPLHDALTVDGFLLALLLVVAVLLGLRLLAPLV